MGWETEDGKHEGFAADLVADGRISPGSSNGFGVLFRRPDADEMVAAAWAQGRPPTTDETYEVVPWDQVVGWQGRCECGWSGLPWKRVDDPAAANWDARRVYADSKHHAPEPVEDAIYTEWKIHIAPDLALTDVDSAAADVATATKRLNEAVAAARAAGASWAGIGAAVGISRQAAHERWGR